MTNTKPVHLSAEEISSFCSQLALILKSGISPTEGIALMQEDIKNPNEKILLPQITETLMWSDSLYRSLSRTDAFPDYLLNMVHIGEETGKLDDVMSSLADYYEKENNLAQIIKHVITYPLVMVFIMVLIILVLIIKVIPVFYQVFLQLGSEMKGFGRVILNIGAFLNDHFIVFLYVLAAFFFFFLFLAKTQTGLNLCRSFIYKFTNTRELLDHISAYRFSKGMALALSSGLSPEKCMQYALGLTEKGPFQKRLDKCCQDVESGEDLCLSLQKNNIFTDTYAKMSIIGSRTGVLDEVMHTIARQYETDVNIRLMRIIAKIEPTFVVILSVIVGAILLSVMVPLMNLMAAL